MAIPQRLANRCVYHFTHLENLPSILEHGLLCTNEKTTMGISHLQVAYREIQQRRSSMVVPCGPGGVVHDYVPCYFCKRSPMLYSVVYNKFADECLIIYLEMDIGIIERQPAVFTNIAANTEDGIEFFDDPAALEKLNWEAIDTFKWGGGHDVPGQRFTIKQMKMAELLIHGKMMHNAIRRIIVFNESIAEFVREIYSDAGIAPPAIVEGDHHYYYIDNDTRRAPVTGPHFIKVACDETIDRLLQNANQAVSPRFNSLDELLKALKKDLGCLPETAEIVGLESENEMHNENVGMHTTLVVQALRALPEFNRMNSRDKLLVEIAAYLHDIGKGPKSRWTFNGGRQKVDPDHPVKALPLIERILSEEIAEVSRPAIKNICKLVCYHDLVGDIVGKGRNRDELKLVAASERQLNMLIAIAKADMQSVRSSWVDKNAREIEELRQEVLEAIQSEDQED